LPRFFLASTEAVTTGWTPGWPARAATRTVSSGCGLVLPEARLTWI